MNLRESSTGPIEHPLDHGLRRDRINAVLAHSAQLIENPEVSDSEASEIFAAKLKDELQFVEQLGEEARTRQLNALLNFGRKHGLDRLSKDDIIALSTDSPEVKRYIDTLHTIACDAAENTTFDPDSSLLVDSIGRAGDMCHDVALHESLAKKIESVKDSGIVKMKEALQTAASEDTPKTYKQALRSPEPAPSHPEVLTTDKDLLPFIDLIEDSESRHLDPRSVDVDKMFGQKREIMLDEMDDSATYFSKQQEKELQDLLKRESIAKKLRRLRTLFRL